MRFNAKKCHLLKIKKQREPLQTNCNIEGRHIEEVQYHPYLGVELTSDLTWKIHTCNISAKANRILNLLRRHLYVCSQEVKSRAVTTLIRSHLEYSSLAWDPYYKQDNQTLEKIQRKGARFVTGDYSYHARRPELASFRTETETQKTDNFLQNCQWFNCCHSP